MGKPTKKIISRRGELLGLPEELTEAEIKYYYERERKYREEHDLNEAGDQALLRAIIFEEILNARLYRQKFSDPDDRHIDAQLSDSAERLARYMKELGSTRYLRIKDRKEAGESIVQYSSLDDDIEFIKRVEQDISSGKSRTDNVI